MGCQLVGEYLPLVAERFKAFGNGIFYSRDEVHLNMMLQSSCGCAYASAYAAKVFYDTENVQPRNCKEYIKKSILHSDNGGYQSFDIVV